MEDRSDTSMTPKTSTNAQIMADCVENCYSVPQAALLINQHHMSENQELVGTNQAAGLVKHCNDVNAATRKVKQGSTDKDVPCSKDHFGWVTKLMARFVILQDPSPMPYFDGTKMQPACADGLAWWDEKHEKCSVIGNLGRRCQTRLTRNPADAVDLEDGKYNEVATSMKFKRTKEARFLDGIYS